MAKRVDQIIKIEYKKVETVRCIPTHTHHTVAGMLIFLHEYLSGNF